MGHCVLFVFPEHHSQATFTMSGANCRPLCVLRAPNAQLPGHILNVQSELYATSWCDSVRNIGSAVQRVSKPTSRHAVLPGAAVGSLYSGSQVTTGIAVATVSIVGPAWKRPRSCFFLFCSTSCRCVTAGTFALYNVKLRVSESHSDSRHEGLLPHTQSARGRVPRGGRAWCDIPRT